MNMPRRTFRFASAFVACLAVAAAFAVGCGRQSRQRQASSATPPPPPPAAVVGAAIGGFATYAVMSDGSIWAWGGNSMGQLGNGTRHAERFPVRVTGISDAVQVVAGKEYACARHRDGGVSCWGKANRIETSDLSSPTPQRVADVVGASGIAAVHADYSEYNVRRSTCAIEASGDLVCWEIGDQPGPSWGVHDAAEFLTSSCVRRREAGHEVECAGVAPAFDLTYQVPAERFRSFAIGTYRVGHAESSCAVSTEGKVRCYGAVMPSQERRQPLMVEVPGVTAAQAVAVRDGQACAIVDGGSVYCWGAATAAQGLVVAPTQPDQHEGWTPPAELRDVRGAVRFAASPNGLTVGAMCAVTSSGDLWCWGGNQFGQIGNGQVGGYSDPPTPPVRIVIPPAGPQSTRPTAPNP